GEADQCMNPDDLARVQDTTKTSPSDIASACGTKTCITLALTGDFEGAKVCADECMRNGDPDHSIEPAELSDACGSCYVDAVLCGAKYCLAKCATDASSQPCVDCRAGENEAGVNCTSNFYICSGLPQD
ncbi:hypothetical protein KKB55_20790, partial [Myxococcota bacterium]|nr:hypothetical protein [Myxococcota bacterium]